MARITVLGGSGYAGAAVVAEAQRRGHSVTSLSRTSPADLVDGVEYVQGSVIEDDVRESVIADRDVVVVALSPRGDMAGKVEGIVASLIERLAGTATRLGYIGGASSLLVEEGGPRLWDTTHEHMPAEVKPEVQTGLNALELLTTGPEGLDWFYVSPPEEFGSWLGTASTGRYTLGGDVLLRAADGTSTISAADLALAILDEIETPAHHRRRFTAIG
ncbi:putative NADH-flavin reductase [Microbacterium sp. SORGH_AS428]|uniref:NAD(P)-dependent oxidoreductase n=1 Tax=Microbacterium sp. SORGH_AS_0428 TaxID=3041788 RepID=UPI002855F8E1|nr:NAD(P)H-binding protein [Microbacterium sp. SORGH_AS_0428]MDR6198729.1 putative NADH-flavin reductase [Microbacterium sp. SORGH_AS_0428]